MSILKKFFKSELIEFYCDPKLFGVIPEPIPAYKLIPDWFKKIPLHTEERDHLGAKSMTAKKCMPLLDAMSMGFIIPLFADVNIRVNKDGSLIEVGPNPLNTVVEFHSKDQLGGKTSPCAPSPPIKFINKWAIKTAPGYSTLFIPPINHIEPRFTCFSGLVDTDKYPKEINFPSIWHVKDYDGIVSAGTPLVTCIAIKRSDMKNSAPIRAMTYKELSDIEMLAAKQISRRNVYKDELREPRK